MSELGAHGGRPPWSEPATIVTVSFVVGALIAVCGLMEDTAISFVVGLRLLDGQVTYRDFLIPHGPVAGWIAALFLWAMPTVGTTYLVAGGILNSVATCLIWYIVRLATRDRLAAIGGAAGTAVWFLQIGGYYHDQLAYVLVLAAYALLLRNGKNALSLAVCGLLLVLAFHAKQTIGVYGAATFGTAALIIHGWRFLATRQFYALIAAYLAGQAAFLLYFVTAGLWDNYLIYHWMVPFDFSSTDKNLSRLATDLLQPWSLSVVEIIRGRHLGQAGFYPMVLLIYGIYLVALLRWRVLRAEPVIAATLMFLLLSTVWSAALAARLYTHVTYGLCGAAAVALFVLFREPSYYARWARPALLFVMSGIVVLGIVTGIMNLYVFSRAGIKANANAELWPLIRDRDAVQYDDVINHLRAVSPRDVALIGARKLYIVQLSLRAAPADPIAFYVRGLTIPRDPALRRHWEQEIVAALDRRRPSLLVLTNDKIPASSEFDLISLQPFPALASYVASRYPAEAFQSNGMVVYRRAAGQ